MSGSVVGNAVGAVKKQVSVVSAGWRKQQALARKAVPRWLKQVKAGRAAVARSLGLASAEQVQGLAKDVARLSKKLDQAVSRG